MKQSESKRSKNMVVNNPKFEISAVKPAQYPKNNLPEVVLVGKSNVGKSSFINTMINRKKQVVSLVKQDKLIFIILMKNFILLIYLDMGIVKCLKKNKNKLESLLSNIYLIEIKFL